MYNINDISEIKSVTGDSIDENDIYIEHFIIISFK